MGYPQTVSTIRPAPQRFGSSFDEAFLAFFGASVFLEGFFAGFLSGMACSFRFEMGAMLRNRRASRPADALH